MAKTASTLQREMLPHSDEAERAVIGALLIDPDAILRAREVDLQASDFYDPTAREVFAVVDELAGRYAAIDYITVGDALGRKIQNDGRSVLDAIGGRAELSRYITATTTSINARYHAEIVKRTAQQRRVIAVAAEITEQAYHHEGPIEGLFEQVGREIFGAIDVSQETSHLYGTDEALVDYVTLLQARSETLERDPDAQIKTSLPDIDRMLGDIPPGMLHVVVARPGVGKTVYMEQIAEFNAQRGHRVAFYHLELSHELMLDRRMARYSGVPVGDLRRGLRPPAVAEAINRIRSWQQNIVYVHCPGWSAERIAADITRLHARGECDLAVVDYLQKIPLPDSRSGMNSAQLTGQVAEILKTVAEQIAIPVVLGSQVSRDFKGREDKRPRLEDIRNSGEIEEKANQIVVLHRPNERQDGQDREKIEVYLEKNTSGSIGKTEVWHRLGWFRFESEAREPVADYTF